MDYGLYTAFLGMRARQRTLDVQANNIANASTTGFKADRLLYRAAEQNSAGQVTANTPKDLNNTGVLTSDATDFTGGAIRETGRALDVAIDGDAFLQIQTPRGTRFTRAGSLTLDKDGQLVTHNGDLVVGEKGAVTIPKGGVTIGEDGTISAAGKPLDRLKLVRFDNVNNALVKEGDALFMSRNNAAPVTAVNSRLVQGALESSNVNPISEMVAMMQNSREFESLQKSITIMMNDLGRKVSTEIGKI